MTAGEILSALRKENGPFPEIQFAWLYEVEGREKGRSRYADAVALQRWESRGIYLNGFEVKVNRADWLKELKDVEKSSPVQRYCRHWWIATPPGVIGDGELPPNWGHYIVNEGGRLKCAQKAPALEAQAIDLKFVASILRRSVDAKKAAVDEAVDALRREHAANPAEKENSELRTKVYMLEYKLKDAESLALRHKEATERERHLRETLVESIRVFEEGSGIPVGTISGLRYQVNVASAAQAFRLANELRTHRGTLTLLRDSIEAYLEDKGLQK